MLIVFLKKTNGIMRTVGLFEWNSVEGRGGSPPREGGCPYPFNRPTNSVAIHRGHGAMFFWANARRGHAFAGQCLMAGTGDMVCGGL